MSAHQRSDPPSHDSSSTDFVRCCCIVCFSGCASVGSILMACSRSHCRFESLLGRHFLPCGLSRVTFSISAIFVRLSASRYATDTYSVQMWSHYFTASWCLHRPCCAQRPSHWLSSTNAFFQPIIAYCADRHLHFLCYFVDLLLRRRCETTSRRLSWGLDYSTNQYQRSFIDHWHRSRQPTFYDGLRCLSYRYLHFMQQAPPS